MKNHVMLDLETLGNKPGAPIVTISAILFDLETGSLGPEFHYNVNLPQQFELGLVTQWSTLSWWLKQNEEARIMLAESTSIISVKETLEFFNKWWAYNDGYYIWGNSNRFDCGLLAHLYDVVKLNIPWDFRNERDVRTIVSLNPEIKLNHKWKGIPHYGIDDCKCQIDYLVKTINSIKK